MLTKINSYINPFSNIYKKSAADFHLLSKKQQITTIALTILAGLGTFFLLGMGGIALFRFLIDRYKIKQVNIQKVKIVSKHLNDEDIINKLLKQGFKKPVEMGGDGRCLFRSIAPQVTVKDLQEAHARNYTASCTPEKWSEYDLVNQADLLRSWAMEEEVRFFSGLQDDFEALVDDEKQWIHELFKDMVQELEGTSGKKLRDRVAKENDSEQLHYCKTNFEEYYQRTIKILNWAGTSELIALSRGFNREITLFGQDHASSEDVSLDADDNILPFYHRPIGRLPPITIFQCHGGGHYRFLPTL